MKRVEGGSEKGNGEGMRGGATHQLKGEEE